MYHRTTSDLVVCQWPVIPPRARWAVQQVQHLEMIGVLQKMCASLLKRVIIHHWEPRLSQERCVQNCLSILLELVYLMHQHHPAPMFAWFALRYGLLRCFLVLPEVCTVPLCRTTWVTSMAAPRCTQVCIDWYKLIYLHVCTCLHMLALAYSHDDWR